ncbi:MAG: hypothetical protein R3Y29_07485 [bacterium]
MSKYKYKEEVIEQKEVSQEEIKEIVEHFKKQDYIKKDGTIKDMLKNAIKLNNLDLPAKYEG